MSGAAPDVPDPDGDQHLHDVIDAEPEPTGAGDGATVDVEAAIEAIQRPREGTGWDAMLPALDLPGFGDAYPDCGDDFPVFCEHCGGTETVGRTCNRAQCPRCAPAWARKQAAEVCGRLMALRAMLDGRRGGAGNDPHQKHHHVVFSPPADWYLAADDPLERTFDVIRELFREFDLEGFVAYHPWAGRSGDDRGAWKDRLFGGTPWETVKDDLCVRPHFHAVVVADKVPGGDAVTAISDATDWKIHRITQGEDSNVSVYNHEDLARAVTYCLSHVGLRDTGESMSAQYRYFGQVLNHELDVFDSTAEEADRLTREVAPLTLGLQPARLRCEDETMQVDVAHRSTVDVEAASARAAAVRKGTVGAGARRRVQGGGGEVSVGVGGLTTADGDLEAGADELQSGAGVPDGPSAETSVEVTREDCHGRLLPISKAPRYLTDPEWRAQAAHADRLADVFFEWFTGRWQADQ